MFFFGSILSDKTGVVFRFPLFVIKSGLMCNNGQTELIIQKSSVKTLAH